MLCIKMCLNETLVAKHRVRPGSGRHGAHGHAESTPNFSSASDPTRKRSLSPDVLREAVKKLLLNCPKVFVDFLGNVITCSVTEQSVNDQVARVTSGWKTPETCGACVVVCQSNTDLANALGNMAGEVLDVDGVPLPVHISQMTPFVHDGSTRHSFRDRLILDLLPFMSAPGVIHDSCNAILIHISSIFCEMGLNSVPEQGGLSHLQLVSSFKFAHCQVPMCWDSNGSKTTFVFVMPLQSTTAVNYVGEGSMDVFGYRKDLRTDLKRGDTVVSFGQAMYLSQELRDTRELVTSVVIAVYTLNSSILAEPFTRPCFKAADDVAALTGVPPMHVCVSCHMEIRDRATEGLWGSKAVDVGKGFHCSHCRVAFCIPAFVCADCSSKNVGDISTLSRVHAWCVHSASSTHDPVGEFVDGWLEWEVSAIQLRAGKVPCFHGSLVQNNLGDALLNVLSLDEIRRAASMFEQWYLFGNIVYDAAPEELQVFKRESTDYSFLWPKWRELYVVNSHCSRVVLAINAVIGALSIGALVRGLNPSGKARKTTKAQPAFYAGTEDNLEEQRSRLWTAARISSGVISASEMQRMALKTLRHIQKGAWCSNFKCTCNIQSLDVSLSTRWDRHNCRGPALDLTIDQLRGTSATTAEIRRTQCRWAEEMTTAEFSRYMSRNPETDHRLW